MKQEEIYEEGFYDNFITAVLEGCKTSKISKYCDLKVGKKFTLVGSVFEVTKINRIRFDEITNEIALKEGFTHRDILKHEIKRHCPNIRKDKLLYQIEFKKIEE